MTKPKNKTAAATKPQEAKSAEPMKQIADQPLGSTTQISSSRSGNKLLHQKSGGSGGGSDGSLAGRKRTTARTAEDDLTGESKTKAPKKSTSLLQTRVIRNVIRISEQFTIEQSKRQANPCRGFENKLSLPMTDLQVPHSRDQLINLLQSSSEYSSINLVDLTGENSQLNFDNLA